jgi:hypothetical protein
MFEVCGIELLAITENRAGGVDEHVEGALGEQVQRVEDGCVASYVKCECLYTCRKRRGVLDFFVCAGRGIDMATFGCEGFGDGSADTANATNY